jgi:hypothetical protein
MDSLINALEKLKPGIVGMISNSPTWDVYFEKNAFELYDDAAAHFERNELFQVEYKNYEGKFFEISEFDFGSEEWEHIECDDDTDEDLILKRIPQVRFTIEFAPGYSVQLLFSYDSNNFTWSGDAVRFKGRGLRTATLYMRTTCIVEHGELDFTKMLCESYNPTYGIMGLAESCFESDDAALVEQDWDLLRRVFGLTGSKQSAIPRLM